MIESTALFLCLSTLSYYLKSRRLVYNILIESGHKASFSLHSFVRMIPYSFY